MKYIDAEKLKKIVEQAMQRALKGAEVDEDLYCDGRADAFEEVLLEIDSLQQEQPVEGLDEEVERYFQGLWPGMETAEQCNTDMRFTPPAIMRLARHFAKWGAEHSKR